MKVIEVFADIWCPFAYVGLTTVMRRREQSRTDDFVLRVRAWPLELVNARPLDPAATAGHVDELRSQVAPDLFTHFDAARFPSSSLPGLALAAAAYRAGDGAGEAVSMGLRMALFEEGLDISRPDVLAGIADAHGVGEVQAQDAAAVRSDWREGGSRGVKGSPHFFCGEVEAFCPSLDIQRSEDGAVVVGRNMAALDALLAECLSA